MEPVTANLFADLPTDSAEELTNILFATPNLKIERIVSTGQASPPGFWYDQAQAEWVAVLSGAAGFRFDGDTHTRVLHPGDYILIAAHRRHRVEWTDRTQPTVWLAIHFD